MLLVALLILAAEPDVTKPALRLTFDTPARAGGKLVGAKLGKDDAGPTLELDGDAHLAVTKVPEVKGKALSVGLHVWADGEKGVLVAHGDETNGYSLHLEAGVPVFTLRTAGKRTAVKAEAKLARGRWVHVLGELDSGGKIRLWIDGKPLADTPQADLLPRQPGEGMTLGKDPGSQVGDYRDDNPFTGKLRDVRIYFGLPSEKEIAAWLGS